jgi:hypothetical protein
MRSSPKRPRLGPASYVIDFTVGWSFGKRQVSEGKEPARIALEALALEGYRTELLSESALRQMLGFETRLEVHAFLKEHGVYLHYDVSDLDQDEAAASSVRQKRQDSRPSN